MLSNQAIEIIGAIRVIARDAINDMHCRRDHPIPTTWIINVFGLRF